MKVRHVPLLTALVLLSAGAPSAQRGRKTGPGTTPGSASVTLAPVVTSTQSMLDFGAVAQGASSQLSFSILNTGKAGGLIQGMQLLLGGAGSGVGWQADLDGNVLQGGAGSTFAAVTRQVLPGETVPVTVTFAPMAEQFNVLTLRFTGNFDGDSAPDILDVGLTGFGGHLGDPYLHVVINAPSYVVDYDGDGSEPVLLDGSSSHTHEPGRAIVGYLWEEAGSTLATSAITTQVFSSGSHAIDLTISDDNVPAHTLTGTHTLDVIGPGEVPGVLARYYDAGSVNASTLLDAIPADPDFGEILSTTSTGVGNTIGGSTLVQNTMVRWTTILSVTTPGTYDFTASGGTGRRLELDGVPSVGPQALSPGLYTLEARFSLTNAGTDLPVSVVMSIDGGPAVNPAASLLTHDESTLAPILNSMPMVGTDAGGNLITIDGLGFFPDAGVNVLWGGTTFTENDFQLLAPNRIEFTSPPGSGAIQVSVQTPNGSTKATTFQYSPSGPVPIDFLLGLTPLIIEPTAAVLGPDRRLYVATNKGKIYAFTFDDTYSSITNQTIYPGVSGLTNPNALGIAINPFDPPSPVRLYVGHGQHFVNGGSSFTGPSPYTGQVSILEGPNFDTPIPLVTGLPTSNHDHAVNGLQFDNNGDLLIAVGSNTNAGVRAPGSGNLPESPLSAAILKAFTSKPGFNGTVTYTNTTTGLPSADQVEGEAVDVDPGVDVVVQAPGHRNPYGLLYTTKKRLYATDNGPNTGFGAASISSSTELPDPFDTDELNFVEYDVYAGSPNRGRGRTDPRQNIYRGSLMNPQATIPGEFRQMAAWLPPSSDGIDEYRSNTFQGQIRGWLIIQEYLDNMRRVNTTADGRRGWQQVVITPNTGGLGVVCLPGGTLGSLDYNQGRLELLNPSDASAVGLVVHDIFPWRAPATGGYPFTVSGVGFGTLGDTTVTIGGLPTILSRVSSTRIEGITPVNASATKTLADVVVTVGQDTATLGQAFRFLSPVGTEKGDWETLPNLPDSLGEVAAAEIDGILYIAGEPTDPTYRYDILNKIWMTNGAPRPVAGNHHSAEVVDGKLYLIGGLGNSSEGTVQIYDPALDAWSMGAAMPWAGGSVNTCVIGEKIYTAGGITGTFTVNNCAVYDPELDSWTNLAPMPDGRNHAAATTDGTFFWIFGGRKGGNFVANGYDQVFRYDPNLDSWESSDDVGSPLVPLPQARGGMGKAIFYRGEFYVMGGETLTGAGATGTGVYDRVDVFDPIAGIWSLDEPLATPRHGIFPVLFESRIFLPGGGESAGFAQSTAFDVFSRQ